MKKLFGFIVLMSLVAVAKADIVSQFETALLSQVQPIHQLDVHGKEKIALLDDVLKIGRFNKDTIVFAQVGPTTTVDSSSNRVEGYLVGGSFNWSPFIKKFVTLPEGWQFLNSQFVISSGWHYNTGSRHGEFSYLQFSVIVPVSK